MVIRDAAQRRSVPVTGFLLALGSAGCFALSGIFASSLLSSGWSPGAAVTARITFAALVLAIPTAIMLRGKWDRVRRAWGPLLMFGLLAIVACQLAFFMAVQFIPPSLALLIEFLGPVMLVFWYWARTRVRPSGVTLLGAGIAVLGLAAVAGIATGTALHPLGVLLALVAAVGNASYFAAGASSDHGIPPLPFVGLGLGIGAVALIIVSATGLLPFAANLNPTTLFDTQVSPVLVVAGMVLISTVISYVLGVAAARHLGATMASFTGYSEPIFGILWTILLLAIAPSPIQWIGAALVIIGVVTVKLGELVSARRARAAAVD